MTELEKDRLIEAFMGWKLSWNNEEGKRGWSFYNEESKEYLHKTTYAHSVIGYTTDWNRLMEALRKFNKLPMNNQSQFLDYAVIREEIDRKVVSYNINGAVNALCEGIEWYNSTLNLKNMNYLDIDTLNDYPSFQSDKSFTGGRGPIDD